MMYDGEIFEHNGNRFQFRTEWDDFGELPWEHEDGHGPVTDWERRDKRPGEMILCEDRGLKRFYDFAEAVKIARRDGWDTPPYNTGTKRSRAARAAMADYERLRAFCNNQWSYIGVIVTLVDDDDNPIADYQESLWGIKSDAGDYLEEVARELAGEIMRQFDGILPGVAA